MKTIALLLARGGSKGIPGKNIISLCGHPLMTYGIKAAQSANLEVFVSSDSKEILNVAKEYGAKTFERNPLFASDTSKSEDALIEFAEKSDFDRLVFIQPTSPLLTGSDILNGLDMMNNYDSVFSAFESHWLPRWTKDGAPFCWDKDRRPRRQDIEPMYIENGAFYITSRDLLLKSKCRYSGKIGIYKMSESRSFQVDTYEDFFIIESILRNKA